MNDLEALLRLIELHDDEADFVGPRDEGLVSTAEEALGLTFPPTYRRFVLELGAGDIAGEEFYGIVDENFIDSAVPNGIWMTLQARAEWGLPDSMIVVGHDGGVGHYVIDTSGVSPDAEAPVWVWVPGISSAGDRLPHIAPDFGEFALHLVTTALGDS